jgi:hypothetical protein
LESGVGLGQPTFPPSVHLSLSRRAAEEEEEGENDDSVPVAAADAAADAAGGGGGTVHARTLKPETRMTY